MTNQEIFDKAVLGLRSQEFQCCERNGVCIYDDGQGRRCAWGHVDESLTHLSRGTVCELHAAGVGVAATLTTEQVDFGMALQIAHDRSQNPTEMEERLRALATQYNLTFPEAE